MTILRRSLPLSIGGFAVGLSVLFGCAGPTGSPAEPEPSFPVYCPNPHGGSCLGDLEPGEYTTQVFEPALTYTVPEGWVNDEDLPGNLLFHREDDPQSGPIGGSYVGVYRDVRAAAQNCEEAAEPGVGSTPAELAAWLRGLPGVDSGEPRPIDVGGLEGVALDLRLAADWTGACPWSDGQPVVALVIGNGVSLLHHVLLDGLSIRLYLLDYEGGNLTIEVTSVDEHVPADEYRAAIEPLLESFRFDT